MKIEKESLINLVRKVGNNQLKLLPTVSVIEKKSKYFNDISTNIDKISEKIMIDEIRKLGFKGKILTEESGKLNLGNSNERIILDPLDGSFFYLRGIPEFSITIALESNGEIIFAVVYNPITKDLFWAERGKGAFNNNKKICVSKTKQLDKSTIILSAYPNYEIKKITKIFMSLMKTSGLRFLKLLTNLNLCYVAAGRYDGYIGFYKILPEWDKLAGFFILEEAHGVVTDFDNSEWNRNTTKFVASNNKLHEKIISIVNQKN